MLVSMLLYSYFCKSPQKEQVVLAFVTFNIEPRYSCFLEQYYQVSVDFIALTRGANRCPVQEGHTCRHKRDSSFITNESSLKNTIYYTCALLILRRFEFLLYLLAFSPNVTFVSFKYSLCAYVIEPLELAAATAVL